MKDRIAKTICSEINGTPIMCSEQTCPCSYVLPNLDKAVDWVIAIINNTEKAEKQMLARFKRKPIVVTAIQFNEANKDEIKNTFIPNGKTPLVIYSTDNKLKHGEIYNNADEKSPPQIVHIGDWIVRENGRLNRYTIKDFEMCFIRYE